MTKRVKLVVGSGNWGWGTNFGHKQHKNYRFCAAQKLDQAVTSAGVSEDREQERNREDNVLFQTQLSFPSEFWGIRGFWAVFTLWGSPCQPAEVSPQLSGHSDSPGEMLGLDPHVISVPRWISEMQSWLRTHGEGSPPVTSTPSVFWHIKPLHSLGGCVSSPSFTWELQISLPQLCYISILYFYTLKCAALWITDMQIPPHPQI